MWILRQAEEIPYELVMTYDDQSFREQNVLCTFYSKVASSLFPIINLDNIINENVRDFPAYFLTFDDFSNSSEP